MEKQKSNKIMVADMTSLSVLQVDYPFFLNISIYLCDFGRDIFAMFSGSKKLRISGTFRPDLRFLKKYFNESSITPE